MRGISMQGGTLRKAIVGKEIYNKVNTGHGDILHTSILGK